MNAPTLTRRGFTKAGRLGLASSLAFPLDPGAARAQRPPPGCPAASTTTACCDAWVRINADGTVTIFTGKVELGQGILTALSQIAAEELDLPLARVQHHLRRYRRARRTRA